MILGWAACGGVVDAQGFIKGYVSPQRFIVELQAVSFVSKVRLGWYDVAAALKACG
jgi:hypothetical protein